jgi:hypothetical protein
MRQDERAWWLRLPLVLTAPRQVFAALRDDSDEAAEARQEPLAAVVFLAGIAGVLMTPTAATLLDDADFDGLLVLVWAIVVGAFNGLGGYFVGGGALYLGASFLGSLGSYRRARHLLGLAVVPLLLSLALWPVRLALFGGDAFRADGADDGVTGLAFRVVDGALLAWSAGLILVGVRTVHGWSWPRSLAAMALSVAALGALVAILVVFAAAGR